MPFITVSNWPGNSPKWLQKSLIASTLQSVTACSGVPGLDRHDMVTVAFGGEQADKSDKVLIVEVKYLDDKEGRTTEVREHLADRINEAMAEFLDPGWRTETFIPFFSWRTGDVFREKVVTSKK